jgi:hypothetical protein
VTQHVMLVACWNRLHGWHVTFITRDGNRRRVLLFSGEPIRRLKDYGSLIRFGFSDRP